MAEYVVVDKEQLEADLTVVADAIRGKGGATEKLEFPLCMKEAVDNIEAGITPTGTIEIAENGKYDVTNYANAEVNVSGEDYLRYATSAAFKNLNLFQKEVVELNLHNVGNMGGSFSASVKNVTLKHLIVTSKIQIDNFNATFYAPASIADETLKRITLNVDTSKAVYYSSTFSGLYALEVIDGTPLDMSSANTSANSQFGNCRALKEVRFAERSVKTPLIFSFSPLLSYESIQSIIDGLADLTGGTGQTLTFHADVKAKLTDEQKTQITSKNWILA